MEKITDSFRVTTPLEQTWVTLLDIERIAPCMPGAQLQEIEGDEFRGIVKVKVGPITAQYKGAARLAEVDESARRIVIDASGRDTRGQGNASAKVIVQMREDSGGTHVEIETDLQVTGKVAQFGRGTMSEISGKLIRQFVESLERDVLSVEGHEVPAAVATTAAAEAAAAGEAGAPAPPAEAPAKPQPAAEPQPAVRRIDMPEAEPVDLLAAAGAPVAKRLVPVAIALLVLLAFWRRSRRRRSD